MGLRYHTAPTAPPRRVVSRALAGLPVLVLLVACATGATPATAVPPAAAPTAASTAAAPGTPAPGTPTGDRQYPDIVEVTATRNADGSYDFAVTVSSPYDRPERYADGWRLLAPDGRELAAHQLAHDHQGEQPFTRTQAAVQIPAGIARVIVEGRDQRSGYGGKTVEVALPGR